MFGDLLEAKKMGQTVPITVSMCCPKTYAAVDPRGGVQGMTQRETRRARYRNERSAQIVANVSVARNQSWTKVQSCRVAEKMGQNEAGRTAHTGSVLDFA